MGTLKALVSTLLGACILLELTREIENLALLTPKSAEVWENDSLMLKCESNESVGYMYWRLNGKRTNVSLDSCQVFSTVEFPLNNSDLFKLQCKGRNFSSVTINKVDRKQHKEKWQCIFGFSVSDIVNVVVKVQVQRVDIQQPNVTEENGTIKSVCKTSPSRPVSVIQWFLSNGTSDDSDDIRITAKISETYSNTNNNLTTTQSILEYKAKRWMNGRTIYCVANNSEVKKISDAKTLNVTYPPERPPYIYGVENGHNYSIISAFQGLLSCIVEGGNPLPNLWWNCIEGGTQIKTIFNKTVVNNITWKASVGDRKTCACHSGFNEHTLSVTIGIDVLYPPSRPITDLMSSNGNKTNVTSVDIIENSSFYLTCRAKSNPVSNLSWTGSITSQSESLKVQNAERSNKGTYTCTAKNIMKQSNGTTKEGKNNASIYISVLYPPGTPIITINFTGQDAVTVTENVDVIENDTFSLKCSARGNPRPECVWNVPFQDASDTYSFESASRNLDGTYTCHARNTMTESTGMSRGGHSNKSMHLNIQYPPDDIVITLSHEDEKTNVTSEIVRLVDNDSFNISCIVTSKPISTVSWTGKMNSSSYFLNINAIKIDTDGLYTCHAENEMKRIGKSTLKGSKNRTIHLDVLYAPVVHKLNDIVAIEGSSINITCNVTPGNPNITLYKWSSDGDNTIFNTSTLHFKNVSRTDNMTYTCTAYNIIRPSIGSQRKGDSNTSFHMDVQYSTTVVAFFLEGFKTQDAIEINQTKDSIQWLNCRVLGNPKSNLTLKFKTEIIHTVPLTDHLRYNHTFKSCTDAGIYTCLGNNGINTTQPMARTLNITVKCIPELSLDKPFKQNITSDLHVPVTIRFDGLAYPEPSGFIWYRVTSNGWDNIHTNDIFQISSYAVSSNLTIKNVSEKDFGQYKLRVENMMGSLEQIFNLIAYGKPDPPSEFSVLEESVTEKEATIQWKPGFNGGLEQYFVLKYDVKGEKENTTLDHVGNRLINYTLDGLESSSRYYLELFSVNSKGRSHSLYTSFTTKDKPSEQETNANIAGPVAGGLVTGIVVLLAIVFGMLVFKRRSSHETNKEAEKCVYQNVQFNERCLKKKGNVGMPMKKETSFQVLQDLDDIPAAYREPTEYYNSPDKMEQIGKIRIPELRQYVSDKSEESFGTEYQRLPSGLQKPCTFARKPENIALNRYNGIYPYDHSRVKIPGEPSFFINACYIDGYARPNAYIASLGPVKKATDDFKTFWKMVWHEKSNIIVMLTNLQEPSGMKCEQYWPNIGRSMLCGDIHVTCDKEEAFAEYTTRSLSVSKVNEQRGVTHLHYTAWPDKKVPEDVTTLLEFRERMKATPSNKGAPVVIHCSAGIGRTGTLIALDRLIEEGQHESAIDVFKCVTSMREQRVKMVQTQEQYIYIYKALVNSLYFDIEMIPVENFQEYMIETNNNIYSKQFQQLKESVEECSKEELDARLENQFLVDKNRRGSDIPGCHHRVFLYVNRQINESNYINAVYVNSLKKKDHFIIAQSPLPGTVSDFVCMIYQENCCCVVTMEDLREPGMRVGQYLPYDGQTLMFGNMKVSCTTLEKKPHYTVRELKIQNVKSESGGKVAYHFQYKKWVTGCDVPSDPKEFVQFIKDVEEYANDLGEDKSHVLVHCLKANERSALYCIVSTLIEKMCYERQGSVLNTVRHLRTRRRTAITTMEQLKFCYQAVSAYIGLYETQS